ncbi:hypothetical protein FBU31_003225 [Coemansia sp. 'formosensis']|nr:hypothetical protein FBU31_003225 [Coemansia sp. 'formosensis']
MAHINSLPENIIAQILFYAAATSAINNLSEWKHKLPLLAVSPAWSKLAISVVFNQVYVEHSDVCPHCTPPTDALADDTRSTITSNANLFISRGCTLLARRLK